MRSAALWGSTRTPCWWRWTSFAVVRALGGDQTYGSDYQEVRQLKALADELKITLLMVHHVRKLGDSDPLNRLSGTTGIVGAADTVLILERSRRSADCATFYATGRDTEYREMELRFHRRPVPGNCSPTPWSSRKSDCPRKCSPWWAL